MTKLFIEGDQKPWICHSLVVVVVVVVPLNAIIAQPIQKLGSMGISLSKGKKYIQMKLLMAGLGIYSHTQKIS